MTIARKNSNMYPAEDRLCKNFDSDKDREALFLAIQSASDGFLDWNIATSEIYFSSRWKEMLGYRDDEIPNDCTTWIERIHPQDVEPLMNKVSGQLAQGAGKHELEYRLRHKDGTYRWFLVHGAITLRDEKQRATRLFGWHTDITEKKLLEEQQLRQTRQSALYAAVAMALAEINPLATMLQQCCEALVCHVPVTFARIWTLHADEQVLKIQASAGFSTCLDDEYRCIPLDSHHLGLIARERRPYLTNNAYDDPRMCDQPWARKNGMIAFAGYPLMIDDQVVGVMGLFARTTFSYDILDTLALLANAVAQGIGRKRSEEYLEQRVQERTRELSILLEVTRSVASSFDLKALFGTILEQLKTVVEYSGAAFHRIEDHQPTLLAYQKHIPLPSMEHFYEFFKHNAAYAKIVDQREVVFIQDIHQEPELIDIFRRELDECSEAVYNLAHSWMGVPLLSNERVIGVLTLNHPQPNFYTVRHANFAFALANQAAIALENAHLYEQVRATAVLQERHRLARELHDSVSQILYSIGLCARSAQEALETDPGEAIEPMNDVVRFAEMAQVEMRVLLFELRSETLAADGLVVALTKQVEVIRTSHQLPVEVHIDAEPAISLESKHALYRIAQEALYNVVRHSRATSARLYLTQTGSEIILQIADNGKGFDVEQIFPGCLGLRSMRERVTSLNGTITLKSNPALGTVISVRIPTAIRSPEQVV